jgi:hypothetical protein
MKNTMGAVAGYLVWKVLENNSLTTHLIRERQVEYDGSSRKRAT